MVETKGGVRCSELLGASVRTSHYLGLAHARWNSDEVAPETLKPLGTYRPGSRCHRTGSPICLCQKPSLWPIGGIG